MNPRDFNYSHILRSEKPSPVIYLREREVKCCDCGVVFITRSRVAKRCAPCRVVETQRLLAQSNRKIAEKRRKLRELEL